MANEVYANNREIACKAADGKSICAFPDVCFTPPQTPATPPGVPIPYPNTGLASDCTQGSKTVLISGKEVMLKNDSYFSKSMGDEAGCAPKKGVITSTNRGKVYFVTWSMDVKFEGKNVVRHMDLTTHNHNPTQGNTAPWIYVDKGGVPPDDHPCQTEIENAQTDCSGATPNPSGGKDCDAKGKCAKSMRCILVPKKEDKKMCCRPEVTGHHMIEDQWVKNNPNFPGYKYNDAPTVCGNKIRSANTNHRHLHNVQGIGVESYQPGGARSTKVFDYGAAKDWAIRAHDATFSDSHCSRRCIESQLDAFYGEDNSRPMNLPSTKQHLGQDREQLQDGWGALKDSPEELTQNMGDILKNSRPDLFGGGTT